MELCRGISVAEVASLGFGFCLLLRISLVNKFLVGLQPHWKEKSVRQPFYPEEFPLGNAAQSRISPGARASKSDGQKDMGRVNSAQEEPSSGLCRFLCDKASFLCRFNPPWPFRRETKMRKLTLLHRVSTPKNRFLAGYQKAL
jgi:hypothetical protein